MVVPVGTTGVNGLMGERKVYLFIRKINLYFLGKIVSIIILAQKKPSFLMHTNLQ